MMWGVFSARGYLLGAFADEASARRACDAWPQAATIGFLGAIGLDR